MSTKLNSLQLGRIGLAQTWKPWCPLRPLVLPRCLFLVQPLLKVSLTASPRFASKLQGPLLITHVSWLSSANLNWNRPSPTSMIFSSGPSFHADRSNHILWLLAGCRVVWWENDQASSMHILQVFSLVETSPPWPLHPPPPSGLSFESSQWSLNPCGVRLLRCCQ